MTQSNHPVLAASTAAGGLSSLSMWGVWQGARAWTVDGMDYASCVKVKPGGARERSVVVLGLAWIRATGAGGHVGVVHTNELLTERKTPRAHRRATHATRV